MIVLWCSGAVAVCSRLKVSAQYTFTEYLASVRTTQGDKTTGAKAHRSLYLLQHINCLHRVRFRNTSPSPRRKGKHQSIHLLIYPSVYPSTYFVSFHPSPDQYICLRIHLAVEDRSLSGNCGKRVLPHGYQQISRLGIHQRKIVRPTHGAPCQLSLPLLPPPNVSVGTDLRRAWYKHLRRKAPQATTTKLAERTNMRLLQNLYITMLCLRP